MFLHICTLHLLACALADPSQITIREVANSRDQELQRHEPVPPPANVQSLGAMLDDKVLPRRLSFLGRSASVHNRTKERAHGKRELPLPQQTIGMAKEVWSEASPKHWRPFRVALRHETAIMLLAYITLVLATAYLVSCCGCRRLVPVEGMVPKPPQSRQRHPEDFHFSAFETDGCCGRDLPLCLCAFACVGIRWGDTLSTAKLKLGIGFYTCVLLHAVCFGLDPSTLGVSSLSFVTTAVVYRQKLRRLFGIHRASFGTMVKDFLLWLCCAPVLQHRKPGRSNICPRSLTRGRLSKSRWHRRS